VTVYVSFDQVLELHRLLIRRFGGSAGLRDKGALQAAVVRPQATFGGEDLYPDIEAKAAAIFHSLVANHPFVDGNKRTGAAVAELLLNLNGMELTAEDDELTEVTLAVARGQAAVETLAIWLRQRSRQREGWT
jgi:death-on-curing protein